MQTNVNVQGLTVEAALTGRREPVYHAAMLDPHTAGELSLDEIRDLVDALLEAHGGLDPAARDGPAAACGLSARAALPRAAASVRDRTTPRPVARRGCPRRPVRRSPTQPRPETTRSTVSDPIQPWPIVRRGDEGHPVITLQELLRAHGQHIAADGVFGPATEAAVKAVQTSRGCPGRRGRRPADLAAGRSSPSGAAARATPSAASRSRSSSATSRATRGLPIDGIFGPLTEQSVRGFQQALSITVDGIVGPVTWRAYVSGMLSL